MLAPPSPPPCDQAELPFPKNDNNPLNWTDILPKDGFSHPLFLRRPLRLDLKGTTLQSWGLVVPQQQHSTDLTPFLTVHDPYEQLWQTLQGQTASPEMAQSN